MDSTFPMPDQCVRPRMFDLGAHKQFKTRVEKAVRRSLSWGKIDSEYTHTTRSHSVEEGRHIDRGADGPLGGAGRLLDCSSARVKVRDEALNMDGRT